MTDHIKNIVIVLDRDYREDDAESIIAAIRHIRGVAQVGVNVADLNHYTAKMAARTEMRKKISDFLNALWEDRP